MSSVVEISPVTRVEGHGSVKVFMDGRNVERVELRLTDSPRLFEALVIGKSYREVPDIVCRICALCSVVHKVTALQAVEKAMGIEVSELTRLTRELIVNGGMIQDHALHLYCLVLPDLLNLRGVAEVAQHAPDLLKRALGVKRVGNLIQETVGGRLSHPVNITVGGLGLRIARDTLLRLRDELAAVSGECRECFTLFKDPLPFPELPTPNYLALKPTLPFFGERMRIFGGGEFAVEQYRQQIAEEILPHSNAKQVTVMGLEPTVGALARLNVDATSLGSEAGMILETVKGAIIGRDISANSLAQAIELCQAVERAMAVIDQLLEIGPEESGAPQQATAFGRGSAACEAPRGLLIHSYAFDESGLCTEGDVITPTTFNQGAMAANLLALARGMDEAEPAGMTAAMERLIRCYDPCISCSVHLIEL
jgi:sulfhydrogenase subunit alpha